MKKFLSILLSVICAVALTSCESWSRFKKSIHSDFNHGLNRNLVLMDYQGDTLKTWTGKFDIREDSTGNQVFFDLNGKRVVIQGGIVVSEEF